MCERQRQQGAMLRTGSAFKVLDAVATILPGDICIAARALWLSLSDFFASRFTCVVHMWVQEEI